MVDICRRKKCYWLGAGVLNPWATWDLARLCYVACGDICKLCGCCKIV